MTRETGKTGEGTAPAVSSAPPKLPPADLPNVYIEKGGLGSGKVTSRGPAGLPSCDDAADSLWTLIRPHVVRWAFDERLLGGAMHSDSFDGILAEHALALEEARDMLSELLELSLVPWKAKIQAAYDLVDEQIRYVRALGSVAESATDQEGETHG